MRPNNPTRRTAVRSIAAACGLAAGGAYLLDHQRPARARIAVQGLQIPDRAYSAPDGNLHAPWLDVDATYAFGGVPDAAEVVCLLMVADEQILALERADVSGPDGSGSVSIAGDVTEADAYSPSEFTVSEDGARVEVPISVSVMCQVRNSDGQTQVRATDQTDVVVTVQNEGETVTSAVQVGGSGRVLWQESADGTPPV